MARNPRGFIKWENGKVAIEAPDGDRRDQTTDRRESWLQVLASRGLDLSESRSARRQVIQVLCFALRERYTPRLR